MRGLQPTQFTLFHLFWLICLAIGCVEGLAVGASHYGKTGAAIGAAIGLCIGHLAGSLTHWGARQWFLWTIRRSSNEELWRNVRQDRWNLHQTLSLLQLATRGQQVCGELPRIVAMLESDDMLKRIYGWDALRLVFTKEAQLIQDYSPRASGEECRRRVMPLRRHLEPGVGQEAQPCA